MVLEKIHVRVVGGQDPLPLIKVGGKFRPTRGGLLACLYGLDTSRVKRMSPKEIASATRLCNNPAQVMCENCGVPFCSIHTEKHMLSCWGRFR